MLLFTAICWLLTLSQAVAGELKPGLVAEYFFLNRAIVDFPEISPHLKASYRHIEKVIDYPHGNHPFGAPDLTRRFYARWQGKLKIPVRGQYTFFLGSDDGSRLFVDGKKIVDNGGLHPWREKSGDVLLEAGVFNFQVDYFQNDVFLGCSVSWSNDTFGKQVIPAEALWHEPSTVFQDTQHIWSDPSRAKYFPRQWQTADGLPHNAVYAVAQDANGYIVAGTHKGAVLFDGVRFTPISGSQAGGSPASPVRLIFPTGQGTTWLASDEQGLVQLKKGVLSTIPFFRGNLVKSLSRRRDGTLLAGTTNGLAQFSGGRWEMIKSPGVDGETVFALAEDTDGRLWIGTNRGLLSYGNGASQIVHPAAVRGLYVDRSNGLWVATRWNGLLHLKAGKVTTFHKADGLSDEMVNVIFQDSRGTIWLGTMGGLCRLEGESFTPVINHEGVSYESVFSIAEDSQGHLWFGTKEGLNQLHERPFTAYSTAQGLSHNNILSVLEDSKGVVWMASWGGGLIGMKSGDLFLHNQENSIVPNVLLSLCAARDGTLWIGGEFDTGLFRFTNNEFMRVGEGQIKDPAVRVIHEDRAGALWIGTSGALYRMYEGKFDRFTTSDGLAGNTIHALLEDSRGTLWIGTSKGLSCRRKNQIFNFTESHRLPSNKITSVFEDSANRLWIGTDGGGLSWFELSELEDLFFSAPLRGRLPRIFSATTTNGLFSDGIFEIAEDNQNHLWMSGFSGVFRVSKSDLEEFAGGRSKSIRSVAFGKADGMSSSQCNGVAKPGLWKDQDGRLWFPTLRGVNMVNPATLRHHDQVPTVLIEQVIADSRVIEVASTQLERNSNGNAESMLVLQPGRGELVFNYTALSFWDAERNRFKHLLEGVDSDWVEAGNRRSAHYNNLSPGSYVFRVIGCDSEGVWSPVGDSISLRLQPHFWQTRWFAGSVGLLGVALVGGGARYVTKRNLNRKFERLERQQAIERERARIASDLHDQLGASLTQVYVLNELTARDAANARSVQAHAVKAGETLSSISKTLHEIVWAVNPKNDSWRRLASFMANYTDEFFENTMVRCRIRIPEDFPDAPLRAEARHNVFLVLKEALNNIVKHANATEAHVAFKTQDGEIEISIKDNGAGFEPASVNPHRNGLHIMQTRIQQLGGNWRCKSAPGEGTEIIVILPLEG